jgi:protein-tyrosine sulfotransferase
MSESSPADPIFILGIMPRSGTNFLWDLLRLHPQCAPARAPVAEDFFLEHSDHLVEYVREVRAVWDPEWGQFDADISDQLAASLGEGLLSFLWVDRDRRLLAKSPSVKNLHRFFTFWPGARLIVLIRDGRSVVQSCMATFGWDFDMAAHWWADAADQILRFQRMNEQPADRYRVVRYEDLVDDPRPTLTSLLDFLELDREPFDFDAAADLPVRGSSRYFGRGRGSVHWEPIEKRPDFDFKQNWRGWEEEMHQRFEWIAGRQLRALGYSDEVSAATGIGPRLRNSVADVRWYVKHRMRPSLGTATRPLRRWLRHRLSP